ncbi:alpha-L-arabinofuranosidase C-terminal domain-containing protein [Paenibacillus sp. MMS20-IR301]|uniref:alpha-L-arabinofuranosidase C-terminal domain-containing protein n=1 Tax=Paenibacillus sp. MMS20-IR301 TaxID=2895946 RepID=UPI0028E4E899|nr:alpha-L-arabinofuranosidase C-terminal domain-containing protein [Paenibacillus sp. MMS20-IR301]WNS43629.1 alpha-L-arabinofuranosidase C-terminal domain-containing protein [Paenibacillus sp. MMS20-IR301]
MTTFHGQMIAHYRFDDAQQAGRDSSGRNNHGEVSGKLPPVVSTVGGRSAVTFTGGRNGSSFIQLPPDLLAGVSDHTGLTVAGWVYFGKGTSVWERIFDFGTGESGPAVFLTRQLRGTLSAGEALVADAGKGLPAGEWMHIAISVTGTDEGQASSAGPVIYLNGEVVADGSISQTASGSYAQLRRWFKTLAEASNYSSNYIGRSQFAADDDFTGSIADFRMYQAGLSHDKVIEIICDSLTDEEILKLAADKYLSLPASIVAHNLTLPSSLMGGTIAADWKSSHPEVISDQGVIQDITAVQGVTLAGILSKGDSSFRKNFEISVIPPGVPPYTLNVHGSRDIADVSEVMYGLFYEDINNAADGGIYAELVQNRSFESFAFDTYSHASGECGCSTGRNREPLFAWSGDTERMIPQSSGGLNEFLGCTDKEVNAYYVKVADGAVIRNRGFADTNQHCAMAVRTGAQYDFTIWAKAEASGLISVQLQSPEGGAVSDTVIVHVEGGGVWKKYGADTKLSLTGSDTVLGQLALTFTGEISIDMVSLIPQAVWGAEEEGQSASAHSNYLGNPNYRLRRDLVQALVELHPKFLRFPGGCISEGSFIWENVYDWKDSVGDVELRKENYNVWGYMMTMGLGYMEYFQLAEDLNAVPLPVMACGVLCQARSDYAHPAGGKLREQYIKNFTDLIDFAISMDFAGNEWAALRKKMGHEGPFDLRYLGVGNENWGTEFFANFEVFKAAIDAYMAEHYPAHELHIISTVGAQADDDAYQAGWKFLSGNLEGTSEVAFTDGHEVIEETVTWYGQQQNYMDTIADEHYYRSNEYLLNNADRYNYYYRAKSPDGSINWKETSKVFVGEYASTDKNTLAGAVAEAALMTGFENNADVVRLSAYAPLFNKVLTDGTYRWTPDCIWFDDETVWFTPNYYVQQLFAKYLGDKVLLTSFGSYRNGKKAEYVPHGGIEIAAGNAEVAVKRVTVTSNRDGRILLDQDFTLALDPAWQVIPGSAGSVVRPGVGLVLEAQSAGLNGLYILNDEWTDYKVEAVASRLAGEDGFYVGAGLTDITPGSKDVIEYAIGYGGNATGVKVYKQGIEAYTLGDYSSSTAAGNLRAASYEPLADNTEYTITMNYGGGTGGQLICSYTDGRTTSRILDYKLEAYNREIFSSVTKDAGHVYVKLVNADNVDKALTLNLLDLQAEAEAEQITLTGESSLVHVPNVNKKNAGKVVPHTGKIVLAGNSTLVNLPANSVNVLVIKLKG